MSDTHVGRIRDQFTRQAHSYARTRQATDEVKLAALVGLCGVRPEHEVLDVACGPGFLTMAFAAHARRATGVDATAALLDLARSEARRRGIANVEFRAGDARALPFPDASLDAVACRAAFHHFPEPDRVLAEMRRVTRPRGTLLVADLLGSEDPETAARHDRVERLCDPTHVRALPDSELRRLFAAARLDVVQALAGPLETELEEWIAHGGPDEAAAGRIRAVFADPRAAEQTGLAVRRDGARVFFAHRTAAFVLARPD